MKDFKIGVIGVGGRGRFVRHAHKPEEGDRVVAGANPDARQFELFKERYGGEPRIVPPLP